MSGRPVFLRSWRIALVGVVAAFAVYGLEQLAPAGWLRGAIASLALLAFGLAAMVTALRAAETTPGRERLPWTFEDPEHVPAERLREREHDEEEEADLRPSDGGHVRTAPA